MTEPTDIDALIAEALIPSCKECDHFVEAMASALRQEQNRATRHAERGNLLASKLDGTYAQGVDKSNLIEHIEEWAREDEDWLDHVDPEYIRGFRDAQRVALGLIQARGAG